jgi:hypothetical protein
MKIFFAVSNSAYLNLVLKYPNTNILVSYHYKNAIKNGATLQTIKNNGSSFFLDSGAFSASTLGIKIDINNYIKFIQSNINNIDYYAGLDDISNYKNTLSNNRLMEKEGLKPLITFHYGEPIELLKDYLSEYNHICLGGVVGKSRKVKIKWLDNLYARVISEFDNKKIHMFGVADKVILERYPFYSADAASEGLRAAFGISAYGINKMPKKTLNFMKHKDFKNGLERFESFIPGKLAMEKYLSDLWELRNIKKKLNKNQ